MSIRKCLVIAGGPWQYSIVQFLKSKGESVCVVNPVKTNTTELADQHIAADVNDLDEINHHIKEIQPKFITSDQSDISTMIVSKLSSLWGLPGNPPEVIKLFSDKYEMYRFAKSIGVPVPHTVLAGEPVDKFPVAVKPVDATNSRGFRKVNTQEELAEACDSAQRFSRSKKVIVQEYVPGSIQITLDGVCSGGKHKTLATSIKGEYFKPGLTSSVRYPSTVSEQLLSRIVVENDRYVEMSGLSFGLTHGEYIITGDTFHLIEIAARGAGASITSEITPWVSGINPYEILYSSLLGDVVDVKSLVPLKRAAILQFYHEDQMKNFDPTNVDRIKLIPGVAAFNFNFRGSQYATDDYNPRHTMGIYRADTIKELDQIIEQVAQLCNL